MTTNASGVATVDFLGRRRPQQPHSDDHRHVGQGERAPSLSTSSARCWPIRAPRPCRWKRLRHVADQGDDSNGAIIANLPVTVASSLGNGLSSTSLTTDSQGIATVNYTATNAGTDSLVFTGGGTSIDADDPDQLVAVRVRVSGSEHADPGQRRRRTSPSTTSRQRSPGRPGHQFLYYLRRGHAGFGDDRCCRPGLSGHQRRRRRAPARIQATVQEPRRRLRCRSTYVALAPARLVLQVSPTAIGPNAGRLHQATDPGARHRHRRQRNPVATPSSPSPAGRPERRQPVAGLGGHRQQRPGDCSVHLRRGNHGGRRRAVRARS